MLGAQLALTKSLIDIFTMLDTYDEAPARERVLRLLSTLTSNEEAAAVGQAYGEAIKVLASDLPRWRSAADIALRLDLHEALPGLLTSLQAQLDAHQLSTAVALSAGPGVAPRDRQLVERLVAGHHGLVDPLPRMLAIRLSVDATSQSDLERVLRAQSWPGGVNRDSLRRVGPLVYVAEHGSQPRSFWRVAAAVAGAGARLRRVPNAWQRDVPQEWFSPHYPVVAWSGAAGAGLREHFPASNPNIVLAPEDLASALWKPRLLHRLAQLQPAGVPLRSTEEWSASNVPAFAPETLAWGAFDAAEMCYLGAARRSTVRKLAQESLTPFSADVNRWSFGKLVTLRIVQAFKSRGVTMQADPARVLGQLEELAGANQAQRVGIDARGVVFVERDGEFVALHSNQSALRDVVLVDEAFKSFSLGGGTFPALLQPSRHTEVHPAVLGGTPVVAHRRLAARAINELLVARGERLTRLAYPEVGLAELMDAAAVGRQLKAAAT